MLRSTQRRGSQPRPFRRASRGDRLPTAADGPLFLPGYTPVRVGNRPPAGGRFLLRPRRLRAPPNAVRPVAVPRAAPHEPSTSERDPSVVRLRGQKDSKPEHLIDNPGKNFGEVEGEAFSYPRPWCGSRPVRGRRPSSSRTTRRSSTSMVDFVTPKSDIKTSTTEVATCAVARA